MRIARLFISINILVMSFSCDNSDNDKYEKIKLRIDEYRNDQEIETPVFEIFDQLDLLAFEIISDDKDLNCKKLNIFKTELIYHALNGLIADSVESILQCDSITPNKKELIDKIKTAREIFSNTVLDYLWRYKNDTTFKDIIKHTFYNTIEDTGYFNLLLYIPQIKNHSVIFVVKSSNSQLKNIDHGGIAMRVKDSGGIDTISVEVIWCNDILYDTIKEDITITFSKELHPIYSNISTQQTPAIIPGRTNP